MLQFFGVVVCEYPNGEDGDVFERDRGVDAVCQDRLSRPLHGHGEFVLSKARP